MEWNERRDSNVEKLNNRTKVVFTCAVLGGLALSLVDVMRCSTWAETFKQDGFIALVRQECTPIDAKAAEDCQAYRVQSKDGNDIEKGIACLQADGKTWEPEKNLPAQEKKTIAWDSSETDANVTAKTESVDQSLQPKMQAASNDSDVTSASEEKQKAQQSVASSGEASSGVVEYEHLSLDVYKKMIDRLNGGRTTLNAVDRFQKETGSVFVDVEKLNNTINASEDLINRAAGCSGFDKATLETARREVESDARNSTDDNHRLEAVLSNLSWNAFVAANGQDKDAALLSLKQMALSLELDGVKLSDILAKNKNAICLNGNIKKTKANTSDSLNK